MITYSCSPVFTACSLHEKTEIAVISDNNASFSLEMFDAWIVFFLFLQGKLTLIQTNFKNVCQYQCNKL